MSIPEIDAVITWVDGSDPVHRTKRRSFAEANSHSTATSETRFDSKGEIYFCIASILKFAPFIRKIFIVTDAQIPAFLSGFKTDKIEIVDHKHLFRNYEDYLPTFNSISIETMLWRIDALAEHFISFNDDFFINQPVKPENFFRNGEPILRGQWKPSKIDSITFKVESVLKKINKKPRRSFFPETQNRAAKLVGFKHKYFFFDHTPRPLRKGVLREFFSNNPHILKEQIRHRFRYYTQFSPLSLAYHIEIKRQSAKINTAFSLAYYSPTVVTQPSVWIDQIHDNSTLFGCVQSLDELGPESQVSIERTLRNKFATHLPEMPDHSQ